MASDDPERVLHRQDLKTARQLIADATKAPRGTAAPHFAKASALALVSIGESLAELVDLKREQVDHERFFAEEQGYEMFPDRPVVDTPPL